MRRFRRRARRADPTGPVDVRDLLDLAARLGIPPDDALRHVSQLIDEANHGGDDGTRALIAPGT
jgi:hypothetical protein